MQNIMKNVMRPMLSIIFGLSVTIYAPILGLCIFPLIVALICKARVGTIYIVAALSAGAAATLWAILPKAAQIVVPIIDSWHVEDSLTTPVIIALLIALSYIKRVKFLAVAIGFAILCSISFFNSGSLITQISDKSKVSLTQSMDKAILALNHLDMADCLTDQETQGNLCFIFDNKLPIATFDKNITKTLMEFSAANTGHYAWQQTISPPNGKVFNKTATTPDSESTDAIIAVKAGASSTTLLIDTTSMSEMRTSALLMLIQCIAMLAYGSLCIGMTHTVITSSQSGYLFATLGLMMMATFQASMTAPTFLLPCLILLSIQNILDFKTEFTLTEKST